MNEDINHEGRVDGMLLYAKTISDMQPDFTGKTHDGNIIMVRTIDLNQDFNEIKKQLESLPNYM
jgi:5-methylcytosine-specific restriction enzyme subunit McrC